jgi:GTPase SAR1 family protein
MNNSVSTTSGKTKLKIVLLGNQSVGKSSIIEKYVKDVFDETSNVNNIRFSPLLESIS